MDKVKFLKDVEAPNLKVSEILQVDGSLQVAGDLTVQGEGVVSNLENVVTPQNTITLREGATTALLSNEYTGIIAEKYDGTNNGMLVFNSTGTAYVGDQGDLQPLATRDEANKIANNSILVWDSAKQKIVDGSAKVYSATAPVMDGTASAGSATTVARSDHKHPTDTSRASQTDLNSHTGNKSNPHGVTAAQLGIDTNTLNKEAYLQWGGRNIVGGVSPIDAALNDELSANRLAFMPAKDITVEYSTNGGSTWLDYGLTDSQKQALVTTDHAVYVGKKINSKATVNDKLRITIAASEGYTYFLLRKIQILASTGGATGTTVHIEKAMRGSETTFSTVATYDIGGWSGWNTIPYATAFGGSTGQTTNVGVLRFTFSLAGVNADYNSNLLISKIRMFGDTSWVTSGGSIAVNGHMYSYDINKNVTFPAKVTATEFEGKFNGGVEKLNSISGGTSGSQNNSIWHVYDWTASGAYQGVKATYCIVDSEQVFNGILAVATTTGNTATSLGPKSITWLAANTATPPTATLTYKINENSTTYSLYIAYPGSWTSLTLTKISENFMGSPTSTFVNKKVTAVENTVIVTTNTTQSTSALKATQDANGNNIVNTYATKSEIQNIKVLPEISTADNGKILRVVDGRWSAVALDVYKGEVI